MSEHEKEALAEMVEKAAHVVAETIVAKKSSKDNIKIWVAVLGFCGTIFSIGWFGGDWHSWRVTYTEKVDKIEAWKEMQQTAQNHKRAEYNRSVQPKTVEDNQ
jgi:hypothetical protein